MTMVMHGDPVEDARAQAADKALGLTDAEWALVCRTQLGAVKASELPGEQRRTLERLSRKGHVSRRVLGGHAWFCFW
jgi:hypothetical protein